MSHIGVARALVSVYDKTGLVPFAERLVAAGVELVSSGGTAATLAAAGLPVTSVDSVTAAPEMLGGRVKTLHPAIHGAILADRSNPAHVADLDARGIEPFELVVVNLYPFRETVADPDSGPADIIEKIDIGGPTMVRAAAKNHAFVGIVTSPDQYGETVDRIEQGSFDAAFRASLAREAFFHTASYDAAIVGWFGRHDALPERIVLPLRKKADLRYGENPHQLAATYAEDGAQPWWASADQLQGKPMSFNNYIDAEAAWRHVHAFDRAACVIVKHTNACGVARADELAEAFEAAWACDPRSAFGSVIAVNRALDERTAEALLAAGFVEVIIAPAVDPGAQQLLASKGNLRVLVAGPPSGEGLDAKRLEAGFAVQAGDEIEGPAGWSVVSERAPTEAERRELAFAWTVAAHTKSNAIVISNDGQAVGIGAGDQSRVGASNRAIVQAADRAAGGVVASDAFFPFRDGIDALAGAGVTAIVQPGGSVRDAEVIAAADQHGIAMVFTGRRHFKH